ncbi:hypothetical protein T03_2330 [Trichinella britovi]|uniref:Uncharacterized protein n=1 Tax=Trichinella britovi TaxID=45882 RepID=A0A0V1DIP3_TRIBR|nr:hypothetical protein T03_2330 [Trichinella britovi]
MYGSHFWTRVVSSNDLPIISADSSHVFSDGNNWSAISGCFQTTTTMVSYIGLLPGKNIYVGICNTLLKRILYHTVRTGSSSLIFEKLQQIRQFHSAQHTFQRQNFFFIGAANMDRANEIFPAENEEEEN